MSGTTAITPSVTFGGQVGSIALSLLDTNFTQVATFLNNANNYSNYLVDTGAANSIVVTTPTSVTATYTAGLTIAVKVIAANTGASTVNVNSLGLKNILNPDGSALTNNQMTATSVVALVYDGTQFLLAGGGAIAPTSNYTGFKNRIINGAMVIDQRNAGASVATSSGAQVYAVDRWQAVYSQVSKFTLQQNAASVTPPTGFINYLGITSSSPYTVGSGEQFNIRQAIEGLNVTDLGWGTASAATVTLSFWVRSSLTGTFGGCLMNSAANRSYPFTFTISAANTWEQKSVTVAGDTTGTWLTTNGIGVYVWFGLGVGSTLSATAGAWSAGYYPSATGATSVVGTSGATFYITGVQLEKGSTATSFDYRPYGTELQLAQRYYEKLPTGGYGAVGVRTTDWYGYVMWQVEKRANPTCTLNGTINIVGSVGDINTQTPTGLDTASTKTIRIYRTGGAFTTQAGSFYISNYLEVSAEL